jgi:NuA3 HAT complex component NTO1
VFTPGFELLSQRLQERYYTSVSDFSRDLSRVFSQVLEGVDGTEDPPDADIGAIHSKLHEIPSRTAEHNALTHEQKELKKLAKRIVKAVKEPLEAATRKEAQLRGREMEEEIRRLDSMPIFASAGIQASGMDLDEESAETVDVAMPDVEEVDEATLHFPDGTSKTTPPASKNGSAASTFDQETAITATQATFKSKPESPAAPPSPPISRSSVAPVGSTVPNLHSVSATDLTLHQQHPSPPTSTPALDVFAHGGIPWYLAPFDPIGTTVHEERYMGRAVLRDMSEELSDMDEDTLTELAPPPDLDGDGSSDARHNISLARADAIPSNPIAASTTEKLANKPTQRRRVGRRAQWSRPRR